MTPLDAAHATVRDYSGGAESLVSRLSKRMTPAILRAKANPNCCTNLLGLDEANDIMAVTGDHRILHAMADEHGYMLVPIEPGECSDEAILELLTHSLVELGELGAAINRVVADGKVTKREFAEVKKEAVDVYRALLRMVNRIQGLVKP